MGTKCTPWFLRARGGRAGCRVVQSFARVVAGGTVDGEGVIGSRARATARGKYFKMCGKTRPGATAGRRGEGSRAETHLACAMRSGLNRLLHFFSVSAYPTMTSVSPLGRGSVPAPAIPVSSSPGTRPVALFREGCPPAPERSAPAGRVGREGFSERADEVRVRRLARLDAAPVRPPRARFAL